MNDEQIENAAKIYLQLLGQDPYELTEHSAEPDENGYVPAVLLSSPKWMLYTSKVKSYLAMMEAIEIIGK